VGKFNKNQPLGTVVGVGGLPTNFGLFLNTYIIPPKQPVWWVMARPLFFNYYYFLNKIDLFEFAKNKGY
jgi:hypothetical protein